MKSIVSYSAVLTPSRFVGLVAVMAIAALPALGAGSAKQLVQKDSDPSIAVYNQGVELMLAKKFPEAQAKFEQAVKENPRFAEAHNNLGYTLRKQGTANYQKSLEHYDRAIELKPKLAEAYMYRGVLYLEMGRKSDAEADLATLQKLSPRGVYSAARLMKLGIAPPRPTPAKNRKSKTCCSVPAIAVQSVNTPNVAVAPINTHLRP
jgi:tetratricopeptide (TPR) repeat protein